MATIRRPYCPDCDKFVQAVVLPFEYEDPILLDDDGHALCWYDGTRGLSEQQVEDAENEDSAFCNECRMEVKWD